jgi:hypothetical protein
MCDLAAELQRCETDTAMLIGQGAATRLANWHRYESRPNKLIGFVQRVIRGPGQDNGRKLHKKGGRSLEQIVIDCGSPPFTEDDIRIARRTLGL